MSVSLYRKYRPQNFASVAGQKSAVDVLTNSILKSRTGHAYLFSGSRGCGKTSVARIFAKALNCLEREGFEPCGECRNCREITAGESLDVIEIDGASNNGVENIRGLKENVTLAPFNSKHKIYIIDEVHMLSTGAFNALLKTLEEPPEHVIFILATTEPHKVPVTIRSRCQHIPFHSISSEDIFLRLSDVCKSEGVDAQPEALREISRQADGALRDALSLLEQVIASGNITLANVEAVFGAGSRSGFERWIKLLRENPPEAYATLKSMFSSGASSVKVFEEIFSLIRDLWLVSKWQNITGSLNLSEAESKFLLDEAKFWKPAKLHELLKITMKSLTMARSGFKSDILLGLFWLSIEAPDTQPQASMPVIQPVKAPANKRTTNPLLRENILKAVHEKNFVIYCALLDAELSEQDRTLFVDMKHIYCYDVLRVDRTAATLQDILSSSYDKIILRHGISECICPKFPDSSGYSDKALKPEAKERKPEKSKHQEVLTPEPEERKTSASPFDKFICELSKCGAKPEKLFTKYYEQQEDNPDEEREEEEEEGE